MTAKGALAAIPPLLIFLFGCLLGMHFGKIALHPLDSPIIFDGAWRILSGQRFFQDFQTPNGFVPIALQSLFFKFLGVNWWSYRLHAGIFNGLFGLIVYQLLQRVGKNRLLSMGYGLLSCIVFYPPMGVPYMEQHSFFFVLLASYLAILGGQSLGWRQLLLGTGMIVCWLLAVLSKQIPGFFAVPISLLAWFGLGKLPGWRMFFQIVALGFIVALLVSTLILGRFWEHWQAFWTYFWEYPRALGIARGSAWKMPIMQSVRSFAWLPFQQLSGLNFIYRYILYAPTLLGLAYLLWISKAKRPVLQLQFGYPMLGISMILACSFFMHASKNQMENGLPLVYLAVGLGHLFILELVPAATTIWHATENTTKKIRVLLNLFLLFVALWTAYDFETRVNASRLVLDFDSKNSLATAHPVRESIEGLDFQTVFDYDLLDPGQLLAWLDGHHGNFLYFGDLTCMYGLSGRPSVSPFLWMHEGLCLPYRDTPDFRRMDERLLEAIRKYQVRYVIFENTQRISYTGLQLECFDRSYDSLRSNYQGQTGVGGFTIWELQP
jgi:hypothetical protein